jgi:transcription elongation factor Elf1
MQYCEEMVRKCPYCGSERAESKGLRGNQRRLICKDCGKKYSVFLDSGKIVEDVKGRNIGKKLV